MIHGGDDDDDSDGDTGERLRGCVGERVRVRGREGASAMGAA